MSGNLGAGEALVYGDGELLFNSTKTHGVLRGGGWPVKVSINVTGLLGMRLVGAVPYELRDQGEEALKYSNLDW